MPFHLMLLLPEKGGESCCPGISAHRASMKPLISWPGDEGKLLAAVEYIIDLYIISTELLDESDVAMLPITVDLHRNIAVDMIH